MHNIPFRCLFSCLKTFENDPYSVLGWTRFKHLSLKIHQIKQEKKKLYNLRPDLQPSGLWCKSQGLVLLYCTPPRAMSYSYLRTFEEQRKSTEVLKMQPVSQIKNRTEWTWAALTSSDLEGYKSNQMQSDFLHGARRLTDHVISPSLLVLVSRYDHLPPNQKAHSPSFLVPTGLRAWLLWILGSKFSFGGK